MTFEQWWEENYGGKGGYDFDVLEDWEDYPSAFKIKLMMQAAYEAGRNYQMAVNSWEGCVDRQGGAFDDSDFFYDEWTRK